MKNKIEPVSRQVIERKLLTALEDGSTVAALFTKQDLDDLIAALYGYDIGCWQATKKGPVLSWKAHLDRRKGLAEGLSELRDAAFPKGAS